ncbi:MAG TPA: serine hydrolase, partial [Thermoanaerobaculaceae bacterium]|nr:serine hydrolase [Thermoanaerobaculaceae bacterium]
THPAPTTTPPGAEVVPSLVAALHDPDAATRERAAVALGRIGPPAREAIDSLIATFVDDDLYLRGAAAVALGQIGSDAVPALIRAVGDADEQVRWSAAIALGRLGPQARDAVTSLIRAMSDSSDKVRWCSAVALGAMGPAAGDAVPAITGALCDRDEAVRRGATLALQQIGPRARCGQLGQDTLITTIEHLMPGLMDELHVPGAAIAVIRGREVLWSKAFGVKNGSTREPVTRETCFEAASMSKAIFAVLVMQLVDGGRLDLDRPLVGYLTEQLVPNQPDRRLVTARMVLSHTSGFPNWRPGGEEREGPLPLLFKPGSRFSYSGEGMFYLQRVVEGITGQPLDQLARQALFAPLGLKHTDFSWTSDIEPRLATGHGDDGAVLARSKYTHPNAAYTLYVTAEDYARLLLEVMKAERSGSPVLSRKSAREMLKHQVALDSRDPIERPGDAQGLAAYWGLGWSLNATVGGDIAHHSGANSTGFRSFSQFSPARGSGIVIMTNGTKGGELWTRLVAAIGDL